jgi:murein DD-endopeptidase MepM/ murein hydrolase activator NlpD
VNDPHLTVILIPEGSDQKSRTLRIAYRRLKILAFLGSILLFALLFMAGSWWYLAARASRVAQLEARLARMIDERERTADVARQLGDLERQYEHLRSLFGSKAGPEAPDLWLPPAGPRTRRSGGPLATAGGNRPTSWPLTERGFVTQPLLEGGAGDHPGLDIAIPSGSYIRAAGAGSVWEVGEDSIYGRYVVIDHEDGYRTMYAHASMALVEPGAVVRQNEVIALSGSSGRSSAPHLHFEVLLNGEPVDPMTLVRQP